MTEEQNNMKNHSFYVDLKDINILIITGVCRSGKTLIARLIATMKNIIYFDEPWLPMMMPVIKDFNLVDYDVARNITQAYIKELLNDAILLRNANFRPSDLSNIWDYKDHQEIFERLILLKSRTDVHNFIKEKNPVLMLILAETTPFLDFLIDTFPNSKIIHVVRNGIDVAFETVKKKWFSKKTLKEPAGMILYRPHIFKKDGIKYQIPWWVGKNHEDVFLEMSEFNKGLYYWANILEKNSDKREEIKTNHPNAYFEIKFEDFLKNSEDITSKISDFVGKKITKKTELFNLKITKSNLNEKENLMMFAETQLKDIPIEEARKINKILFKFGYNQITMKGGDTFE